MTKNFMKAIKEGKKVIRGDNSGFGIAIVKNGKIVARAHRTTSTTYQMVE